MGSKQLRRMLIVFAGGLLLLSPGADGQTHEPADKTSASGSTVAIMSPNQEVVLLSELVKTSNPADMILSVTLECSIVTDVTTVGNDSQKAFGQVEVWVEIDGKPVAVSTDDTNGGRVVFCNRTYQRDTSLFDDEDATIRTFMDTRTANAFNWMALNTGAATHRIEVKGQLTQDATEKASAQAAVGNRTLIVEVVHASNDETVDPGPTPAPSGSGLPLPKL